MSRFEFKLPDIGEGVAEGEIVNWLVNEGDSVNENQEMVEVMTDKATVTIGAPKTGTVAQRRSGPSDVEQGGQNSVGKRHILHLESIRERRIEAGDPHRGSFEVEEGALHDQR